MKTTAFPLLSPRPTALLAWLIAPLFFLLSLQSPAAQPTATPDSASQRLPLFGQEPVQAAPGVLLYTSKIDLSPEVWIYVPANLPEDVKVPLVLISASGSRGYHGANLRPEDHQEHLAYAAHGMIVAAYSLPGIVEPGLSRDERRLAVEEFQAVTGSGVRTARAVLNHVLYEFPQVDRDLVFAAGINSAASVAFNLAAYDDSLAGVIAYAPSTDLLAEMGELPLRKLAEKFPGLLPYVKISSPFRLTHRIDCPVFIFHSRDDQIMQPELTERFVNKLSLNNPEVTWIEEKAGDHYGSMLNTGIGRAVAWISQTTSWQERLVARSADGSQFLARP